MPAEAIMRRLFWRIWYAQPKWFVKPGFYFCWHGNHRILPLPRDRPPQLVEFAEQTVVFARNQPEYRPLPAYQFENDPQGTIVCCWKLSWLDRLRVMFGGCIWHSILTFNGSLQPQLITTEKPRMPAWISKVPS